MDDEELGRHAALLQEAYTVGALIDLLVTAELREAGAPATLFSFLGWVRRLEPVTPGRLAEETGMPPTTIRDYVRRLIERGDARKAPNPADGRSYHLVLTAKGHRLMDRGWPAVKAAYLRVAPNLDRDAEEYLVFTRELREALRDALRAPASP